MSDNQVWIFFWNNSFRYLFSSNPISSSILVHFEWFKTWWVHQLGFYQTCLYFRGKRQWYKILSLKSKSVFITHHQTLSPLTPNTPYLLDCFTKLRNFCDVGSSRWRVTNVLKTLKGEEQCMRTQLGVSKIKWTTWLLSQNWNK